MASLRKLRRSGIAVALGVSLLATACASSEPAAEEPAAEEPTAEESAAAEPAAEESTAEVEPAEDDLAAYFEDRRIDVVVPYSAGGGYDLTARLILPYLRDALPGNPNLVVVNQGGGGGSRGVQYALAQPADDVLGMIAVNNWYAPGLVDPDAEIDVSNITLLGSPNAAGEHMACARADRFTSWEDQRASGDTLTFSALSSGGTERQAQLLQLAGFPIELVRGYDGTAEMIGAFAQGEVDATVRCDTTFGLVEQPEVLASPGVIPLWWTSTPPTAEYLAELGVDMDPADIPELMDVEGFEVDETILNAFNAAEAFDQYARTFWVQSSLPPEIIEAWQVAFAEAAQDPAYREELAQAGEVGEYLPPDGIEGARAVLEGLSEEGLAYYLDFTG